MNVLIIEDDPMVEFIHRNYLEKVAIFREIYSTNSQIEAHHFLEKYPIDLILLDIHIKDGNGLILLEELRAIHINAEVIAITAASEAQIVKSSFHLGVIDYLIKPFTFDRFEVAIQRFLQHHKAFDEATVGQETIDHYHHKFSVANPVSHQGLDEKGLSETTYQHILQAISRLKQPFTIQELADASQFSHVSVRKYVAYMEEQGELISEQIYTKVGRPFKANRKAIQ